MSNGDDSIFPKENQTTKLGNEYVTLMGGNGLTKREYFACQAMQGILANGAMSAESMYEKINTHARLALEQADALLAKLSENYEPQHTAYQAEMDKDKIKGQE